MSDYESGGQDDPAAQVRWTLRRNFEAVLDLMAEGRVDCGPLISGRYPLERAADVYDALGDGRAGLGLLLECPNRADDGLRRAWRRSCGRWAVTAWTWSSERPSGCGRSAGTTSFWVIAPHGRAAAEVALDGRGRCA